MPKPRVFVGSSSEGLPIAQTAFAALGLDTTPTLWTHQLFLPGQYPLEVLENELRRHDFAILVASPDDELVKRGLTGRSMFFFAVGIRWHMCKISPRARQVAGSPA
jgi:predicted nucleotide-binding protein